jgi:hypothetical protein
VREPLALAHLDRGADCLAGGLGRAARRGYPVTAAVRASPVSPTTQTVLWPMAQAPARLSRKRVAAASGRPRSNAMSARLARRSVTQLSFPCWRSSASASA